VTQALELARKNVVRKDVKAAAGHSLTVDTLPFGRLRNNGRAFRVGCKHSHRIIDGLIAK
jgi:hypothetical protein